MKYWSLFFLYQLNSLKTIIMNNQIEFYKSKLLYEVRLS